MSNPGERSSKLKGGTRNERPGKPVAQERVTTGGERWLDGPAPGQTQITVRIDNPRGNRWPIDVVVMDGTEERRSRVNPHTDVEYELYLDEDAVPQMRKVEIVDGERRHRGVVGR